MATKGSEKRAKPCSNANLNTTQGGGEADFHKPPTQTLRQALLYTNCWLFLCLTGVVSSEKMAGVFSYESSEIDWCEDNYKHSEHVVEYFNTVSSTSLYSSI